MKPLCHFILNLIIRLIINHELRRYTAILYQCSAASQRSGIIFLCKTLLTKRASSGPKAAGYDNEPLDYFFPTQIFPPKILFISTVFSSCDILGNKDFCAAFWAIKKNHAQLAKDYFKVKEEIFEMLRKEGYMVSEDEQFYMIEKDHYQVKVNNNMESYFLLQRELEKEEYQVILKELVNHKA